MKGLLITLCALAGLMAVYAGGCAGLITLFFPTDRNRAVPAIVAALAIFVINVSLIVAVWRGTMPRRRPLFVILTMLDILAVGYLAAVTFSAIHGASPIVMSVVLGFLAKGILLFAIPGEAVPDKHSGEPMQLSSEAGGDASVES